MSLMSTAPTVVIHGHQCIIRRLSPDAQTESWQVVIWYKPASEFVIVATEPTEEQALQSAEKVLSDRERFRHLLMQEGTRRLEEVKRAKEHGRSFDPIQQPGGQDKFAGGYREGIWACYELVAKLPNAPIKPELDELRHRIMELL